MKNGYFENIKIDHDCEDKNATIGFIPKEYEIVKGWAIVARVKAGKPAKAVRK